MMQPIVLDTSFDAVKVLDSYKALIWTERYSSAGDFEFHAPASTELIDVMRIGRYLYLSESDTLMIIERIEIRTDIDDGDTLTVSGSSLSSILARRIIWSETILDGYLEGQIQKLLNQNVISASDQSRRISNFIFAASGDSSIAAMTIKSQYTGENLYKTITEICEERGLGFKVSFNDSNQFVFKLINGKDRSYSQNAESYVVFSPRFDNLIESDYKNDKSNCKTIALIAGEGNGNLRVRTTLEIESGLSGINRREIYVDARDIQKSNEMTDAEYLEVLRQRGKEKMSEYEEEKSFGASMEVNIGFKFGVDFFLGDIVQVENQYGISGRCRVIELIRSMKPTGYYEYPTFKMLEDN